MTNGSSMKVESIAECSKGSILCNTFDLHYAISLENEYLAFFLSGRLRQVLLYVLDFIDFTPFVDI